MKSSSSIKIVKPTVNSIIWVLLCMNVAIIMFNYTRIVEYSIWAICGLYALCDISMKKISRAGQVHFCAFLILIAILSLGLIQICTRHSLVTVGIVGGILCATWVFMFSGQVVQIEYVFFSHLILLLVGLVASLKGIPLGNTIPGELCFLSCGVTQVAFIEKGSSAVFGKTIEHKLIYAYSFFINPLFTFFICWRADARTAALTLIIVWISFFVLSIIKSHNKRTYNMLFFLLVIGIIILTIFYINIREYSWYEAVNSYSQEYFEKNIDSSRPFIWSTSINELSVFQFFFGAGTGKLPSIERYANSSFHNSFIQMLMQNGILGLGCFVGILFLVWRQISAFADRVASKFGLAAFVGVVVYNCFETALLQNKSFLGLIQWCIIGICVCSVRLSIVDKKDLILK